MSASSSDKDTRAKLRSAHEGSYGLNGVGFSFGNIKVHRDDRFSYNSRIIQPKLKINRPGDVYEQEADAMAEKVTRMPQPLLNKYNFFTPAISTIQRKCPHCEEEEKKLHRKESANSLTPDISPAVEQTLQSIGQPIDTSTRSFMEQRFGFDFSNVQIHNGALAHQSSKEINALAYTRGNHVVFGSGQYQPGTETGKRLLAHELTHVVQQEVHYMQQDNFLHPALKTIIQRQTGGTPPPVPPTPPRIVYIDANVIDQINRGNAAAAKALQQLRNSGADIRISQQAYNELVVQPDIPRTATANRLILEEMGIKVGPSTPMSARVEAHVENLTRTKSGSPVVSEADARVIAETKAAGEGEIWSFDKVIRTNPKNIETTFGVKVAPESTSIPPIEGVANYKVGRQLLGLKTVEISISGKVTPSSGASASQVPGEATTTVEVQSTVNVTSSVTKPDGSIVSEVEVKFTQGLGEVNSSAPPGNKVPGSVKFRLVQNTDGSFASAEPLTGEPPSLVEALGRQIVSEAGASEGAAAGVAEGAAVSGAKAASKALPYVHTGLKWGGPILFVIVTGYQLVTATPKQRPKVLVKAAGGLAGGIGTGFLVCNALLDLETAGWGIVICGILAGGAGGYAGSELAGKAYDAANPPPGLTELEQALLNMEHQPNNVKALFYTMINQQGSNGIALTPEFINEFIFTVPTDIAIDELYTLAGQLQNLSNTDTLQTVIDRLSHAIYELPRRKPKSTVLPPKLNVQDILELNPSLRYRLDAPGSGTIRIFPGYTIPPAGVSDTRQPEFAPLLEVRIPGT